MAIPVNIEYLLHKRKIESARIGFKTGWNPDKIYRTICAFANDFDNIGGGYIVVGVQEEENTGIAKRPVTGVTIEELDKMQRDMIGFNHKIEPDKISILSYAGPDRSISIDTIHKAERLKSRRYRNRRLGDYLKELQLSEGRGTGIPTIQNELRRNGSAPAVIEPNEERSYFLIEIPCREGFGDRVLIGDDFIEPLNDAINNNARLVLLAISRPPLIKRKLLLDNIDISKATLERILKQLSSEPLGLVEYQGSLKTGGYVLTEKGKDFVKSMND